MFAGGYEVLWPAGRSRKGCFDDLDPLKFGRVHFGRGVCARFGFGAN